MRRAFAQLSQGPSRQYGFEDDRRRRRTATSPQPVGWNRLGDEASETSGRAPRRGRLARERPEGSRALSLMTRPRRSTSGMGQILISSGEFCILRISWFSLRATAAVGSGNDPCAIKAVADARG